jgi:hypothetical protein
MARSLSWRVRVSSRKDVIIPLEELMRVVEMGGENVGGRTSDWERMNVSSGSSSSVVVVDSVVTEAVVVWGVVGEVGVGVMGEV